MGGGEAAAATAGPPRQTLRIMNTVPSCASGATTVAASKVPGKRCGPVVLPASTCRFLSVCPPGCPPASGNVRRVAHRVRGDGEVGLQRERFAVLDRVLFPGHQVDLAQGQDGLRLQWCHRRGIVALGRQLVHAGPGVAGHGPGDRLRRNPVHRVITHGATRGVEDLLLRASGEEAVQLLVDLGGDGVRVLQRQVQREGTCRRVGAAGLGVRALGCGVVHDQPGRRGLKVGALEADLHHHRGQYREGPSGRLLLLGHQGCLDAVH
ncbi:hypothetical protein ACFFX0_13045 [Citricoccus parietis]|uniref:Uncharacterized protein n=1 Tax=Citricoccus parietis TaxID=592307 RepID=A0ABV5FZG6_9MICC